MIERLGIAIGLFIVGAVIFSVYRHYTLRRAAANVATDPLLHKLKPGVPAIIYFTTPDCIPCRVQQQPALQQLVEELGEDRVQIVKVDATVETETASRWGVMTAPTLFILDTNGQPRQVYYGVTDAEKLKQQLQTAQSA